jgi:hypothetical protein
MDAAQIMSRLPPVLQELLPHLTPHAFKVVDPFEAAGKAAVLAKNLWLRRGWREAREGLTQVLPPGVQLVDELRGEPLETLHGEDRIRAAERVLALYFAQVLSRGAVFLDMRSSGMRWDADAQLLLWQPPLAQLEMSPTFKHHLRDLYTAFYLQDDIRFQRALTAIGILSEGDRPSEKAALLDLIHRHLGPANQGAPVTFLLSELRAYFFQMFDRMIGAQRKLPFDFALLGLTLASLYVTLESLGEPLDAQRIFLSLARGSTPAPKGD